ncbi:imidazole glycerol phosphate synthase subunit HisH [Jannaschia aquimarina]|uniref:Imidazole glycerol phosphate synthase subunit HisH n=1 Tax=Jannaschia aquimarina TaxID=935700 RepID=A0A0D1DAC2_9RHOB|nr:imidazole glycerol phosphate synthase subunit HisH [Jannaschia aquimarina]KIT16843.1 Imidazole glycerol phosphate synthase subunit HisH 1 [Jannaschia aquimarina]SNT13158.1 imidazole glycerol phosphate synthase subunit hisH [Jannaschia aquimarina]
MSCILVDIGHGNLHSAQKAFERMAAEGSGARIAVTSDPDAVAQADRIVLPGDGAFPACRRGLAGVDGLEEALRDAVESRGVPFLGICVGMQLLATAGFEFEETPGLGWIAGTVDRIPAPGLKVPHMGWNDLVIEQPHPLLDGLSSGDHAYFVHSYAMQVTDTKDRLAYASYGGDVTAIVARGNIAGTQFHPEKSQRTGLRLIANFLEWTP